MAVLVAVEEEEVVVVVIGPVSLSRENGTGTVGGRKSIFSMLTYRTSFCFWL